jgi:hypothetical protein
MEFYIICEPVYSKSAWDLLASLLSRIKPARSRRGRPDMICLMGIARKVALYSLTGPRQPIAIFRKRRPEVAQLVRLLMRLLRGTHGRTTFCNLSMVFVNDCARLVRLFILRIDVRMLAAAEIAAEKDSESWRRGTHDSDLQLELSPDEEHVGRSGHVCRSAGHCSSMLAMRYVVRICRHLLISQ